MSTSASDNVVGITIACNADRHHRGVFETTIIKPSHKIYELGVVCPLYNKVGLPLVMYRHLSEDPLNMCRDPGLDNQIATFLMIEPSNGFAKAEWQQCVGTVTVMRQDKKPLTPEAIETLWMYADSILDLFGEGDDPKTEMTAWGLLQFCEEYREGRLENGHQRFEGMALPL